MQIKKILSAVLCIFLCIGSVLPAFAADRVKYTVSAEKANMLPSPDALRSPIWTLQKGDIVYVSETQNNFGFITLKSNGISGWVYMPLLTFSGEKAQNTENIKKIYVKSIPTKTSYIEGEEEFSAEGLKIFASFSDGKQDAEISGYKLYVPDFSSYGTKTVYISYSAPGGAVFNASFSVEVIKVPLGNITVVSLPDKTDYIEGETLDLSGLKLKLSYSDGRADEIYAAEDILTNRDFTLLGCHSETQDKELSYGKHTLNIYYKYPEISCSVSFSAKRKTLLSLSIKTLPKSLVTYSKTAVPSLDGLTLTAVFDNNQSITVYPKDCNVNCDPSNFILGSGNIVTVSYGGKSIILDFTYAIDEITGLKVITPRVMNFTLGEKIDLSELKVYITKKSGEETPISDYSMSEIDPSVSGAQTVQIVYKEFSEVFNINISPYFQRGDVDGLGDITAADARRALRAAVKLITLSGYPLRAADADADGEVTAADARLILRASVGLENILSFDNLIVLPN
ncbi:MAG: bacterial Ig-like domain-containing protein [Oscillospiraceae bacterium]|nr:bacterial Ig-like domain-containing protein [Oscillospiraceae bacterium]